MFQQTTINELPEEMLENIFSHLGLEDRKRVAEVCHRWSLLALQWATVQLEVDFRKPGHEDIYHNILLASQRPYRHLVFYLGYDQEKCEQMLSILGKFSTSLESLKLLPNFFVPVELRLLAEVIALSLNLKRLHLDACTFQHKSGEEVSLPPLNNLQDLYMENNLLDLREVDIREVTPNVTGLHVQISYYSQRPQDVLRHFSPRLRELEIWFLTEDHFMSICKIDFPRLEKLNFYCVDLTFEDYELVETVAKFFRKCHRLKDATLRCNIDASVLGGLTQSCTNLQYLCLSVGAVTEEYFLYISELKTLKCLRIEEAVIHVPEPQYCPALKSLHRLTLYSVQITDAGKLDRFVSQSYPSLAILELLHVCYGMNQTAMFQLHSNVFTNMVSLERVVLSEPEKLLDLDLFLYFASLSQLRELRLEFRNFTDYIYPYDTNLNHIRTLVLDVPLLDDICLLKLMELMPKLRILELASVNGCSSDGILTVRERLPKCDIRIKRRVQIAERL